MRIKTLALYLIGNRQAILELAADRQTLWVGFLFVLSAGFAREYDGEDLVRKPWYLLIPVGASLVASFLLFLVACGSVFIRREGRPAFFHAYRSFLILFWLTAPLAWLYAIPYERFLSPGNATIANLWTLAFVAVWRVALMVRVVSVITDRGLASSFCLVMLFADAVALTAVVLMPKPVISVMGGVRMTQSEAVIAETTLIVGCLGFLSAPIWLVSGVVLFFIGRPRWQIPVASTESTSPARDVWILAACSLLIWLPILPFTQTEQWLAAQVERDMKAGRIAEMLDQMSAHKQSDFPPGWDPPPHIGYHNQSQQILDVMEVLLSHEVALWVRTEYVEKLRRYMGALESYSDQPIKGKDLARLTHILLQLPEGSELAHEHRRAIDERLQWKDLPADERANFIALLQLADKYQQPKP